MAPDTLSLFERQQLINQYKILEFLDSSQSDYYRECQRILREGYSILYGDVFETWEEMSQDECRYVFDVLDMYRVLRHSYERLNEKQGISEDELVFEGFDGNNESKNLALLEFVKEQGRWQETLGEKRDFNSHSMHTITLYPQMLKRWEEVKKNHHIGDWLLSADQMKYVLRGE